MHYFKPLLSQGYRQWTKVRVKLYKFYLNFTTIQANHPFTLLGTVLIIMALFPLCGQE